MNGSVRRVQGALALDEPRREALENLHEQVLHGSEVVVDEPVVDTGLLRDGPCRDACVSNVDEKSLRSIEKRRLRFGSASGHGYRR